MKNILLMLSLLLLAGCTHSKLVYFDVETDPPGAVIESGGVSLCDSTPCTIEMKCKKNWLSGSHKSHGVELTVVPKRGLASDPKKPVSVISKSVDPCKADGGKQKLYFNMLLEQTTPVNRYDIRHHND